MNINFIRPLSIHGESQLSSLAKKIIRWTIKNIVHIPLIILVLVVFFPLFVLITNALKDENEIRATPIGFPSVIHFSNFITAWQTGGFGLAMRNSLIVCIVTIIVVSLLGGLAAYSLARMRPSGYTPISIFFLLGLAVPPQLYLIPLFNILQRINLVNNLQGLTLVYIGIYLPFTIFYLRSFFLGLPKELEDAAKIDGCSDLQLLFHIVIPISKPAFQSLAVILANWTWNEFMFAVTLLSSPEIKTVSIQYLVFVSSRDTNLSLVSTSGIITFLPVAVLFIFLQKNFIEGMVQGSIK